MDDRHLKNPSMDIRFLKPEFMVEEQQKLKVEVTILKKLVAQLTDKVQKQEAQIDALMSLSESNCQKFNDIQDTLHSQDPQNVRIAKDVQNRGDVKNFDVTPNSRNTQNTLNSLNTSNTQKTQNTPTYKIQMILKMPKI